MAKTYNIQFRQPFNMVISGSSNSGKTEFVFRLIKHADVMISPPVDLIIYCYNEYQNRFKEIKGVYFHHGFEESLISKEKLKGRCVLLILDDMMSTIDPDVLSKTFTIYSHHRKVLPLFITHNLFYTGLKCGRTIALNTVYNVIMKTTRDKASIEVLARQVFLGQVKFFMESFNYATRKSYSYLVLDSKNDQDEEVRLRTQIFPGEDTICFIPNKRK